MKRKSARTLFQNETMDGPTRGRVRIMDELHSGRVNSRAWTLHAMEELEELTLGEPLVNGFEIAYGGEEEQL